MKKYKINKIPRYIHISRELIDSVKNVYNNSNFVSNKPLVGLWYARGIEWIEFESDMDKPEIKIGKLYISTEYKIYKISIKKRVKISEKPNKIAILTISSFKQLSVFVDKFFIEDHKTPKGTVIKTFRTGIQKLKFNRTGSGIAWEKVKKLYGGVEFKNYYKLLEIMRRKKLNDRIDPVKYNWLRSYDVNGGVVWNSKAIKIDLISPDK